MVDSPSTSELIFSAGDSSAAEITALICDIRGFTRLLESTAPSDAFRFIEAFFREMIAIVEEEGGTVNTLMGDGFLAQFGLGPPMKNHGQSAVNAAIRMRESLLNLNKTRHAEGHQTIAIGIGLHSGTIAAGTVRLGMRRTLLLIGDTINLASRIESLTKDFSVDVLVSEATHLLVKELFPFFAMPRKSVKGKSELVETYWLQPHAKVKRD